MVSAAHCDYNGWIDLATVAGGTWSGVVTPNASDGTVYSSPMSGTTPPGTHDVHADPSFANATATLLTWDSSLGGAGTLSSALARVQANLDLTKTSLLPYIRTAFTPGVGIGIPSSAGHDGANIGAV